MTPNIPFKYVVACGVSFTKCNTIGAVTHIKRAATTPHMQEIFRRRIPYSFPRFRFPAPSSFPTIIPVAPEIPALRQHTTSLTTAATEFAAAASTPRCPIKDE